MSDGIYQIHEDGQLFKMTAESFHPQKGLQKLLEQYPSLLPGDQIDSAEPRKWLLIAPQILVPSEEYGKDRGSVDHLFLDQDAIPTLVSVKGNAADSWHNLVGQSFDRATHASLYWSVETIRDQFESYWQDKGREPEQVLREFLNIDADREPFWKQVKKNLEEGKIRLIFVSDEIPPELQKVVEFLNAQMDPAEILAVEIRQYVGKDTKILIPKVVGQTEEAQQKKSSTPRRGRQWDEVSFLHELEARSEYDAGQVARRTLNWAKNKKLQILWGKGRVDGAFSALLPYKGESHLLISVQMNTLMGDVQMQFGAKISAPPFNEESKHQSLLQRFPKIQGIRLVEDSNFLSGFLSARQAGAVLEHIFNTLDWVIQEIQAS